MIHRLASAIVALAIAAPTAVAAEAECQLEFYNVGRVEVVFHRKFAAALAEAIERRVPDIVRDRPISDASHVLAFRVMGVNDGDPDEMFVHVLTDERCLVVSGAVPIGAWGPMKRISGLSPERIQEDAEQ